MGNISNHPFSRPRGRGLMALCIITLLLATSCSTLKTNSLHYQSVRKTYRYDDTANASIVVLADLYGDGTLKVEIRNNSDEIMTIDMEKSFVVNTSGKSQSFYDPTIRVESITTSTSQAKGGSVNLGAVTGALGIGGVAGTLARGVNVGGGSTTGVSNTSTTYMSDMPQVSLAPHSRGAMPKEFNVGSIGERGYNQTYKEIPREEAEKFALVILWSIDGGKTYVKYEQWYYINADYTVPVRLHGHLNVALREILRTKPDCIYEPWWVIYTQNNRYSADLNDRVIRDNTLSVDYQ